jgi:hypothetical protein
MERATRLQRRLDAAIRRLKASRRPGRANWQEVFRRWQRWSDRVGLWL